MVARAVVRWHGPDYEGAGGVKADGLAVVLLVRRGDGERRCDVRHHDIPRDVPRPIGKALNVVQGNGVLVRDPKLARLLLIYVFCQLKVVVR